LLAGANGNLNADVFGHFPIKAGIAAALIRCGSNISTQAVFGVDVSHMAVRYDFGIACSEKA
jgi:hypothetical protein